MSGVAETLAELVVPIGELRPYPGNPRRGKLSLIRDSLVANGQYRPLVVNRRTGEVLAGNHTYLAALDLGWSEIAATFVDVDEEQARRIVLVDNRASDLAEYDNAELAELLRGLEGDLTGTGWADDDLGLLLASLDREPAGGPSGQLAERFGAPPFSVLDARSGAWQARKQAWLALGIESELGRPGDLLNLTSAARNQQKYFGAFDHRRSEAERLTGIYAGTSVFDPVLCELAVRWFSPAGGRVLDPFAGGSVRGIVAARLARTYRGLELRPEQIAANEEQADRLDPGGFARWVEGDAREAPALLAQEEPFDLLFSCPPYFNLEVYSDDPRDLSTAGDYDEFVEAYRVCIAAAGELLAPDRFAVWVVTEIRERGGGGYCRGFLADTIEAFEAAGLRLYNECVLVQPAATAGIRAARHFTTSRKLERTHQTVLVFAKGDPIAASEACGDAGIDLGELAGDIEAAA